MQRPRLARLDLEEDALVLPVFGICARVDAVQHACIPPRPCPPHVRHMGHREPNHGLEVFRKVVVERPPRPDRPTLEQRSEVINALLVQRVEGCVLGNAVGFLGDGSDGDVHHRRQRLWGRLKVEEGRFAVNQGPLDCRVLAVTTHTHLRFSAGDAGHQEDWSPYL